MRLFASLSAGLLALAFAGAAFAQSVSTLPVKNASGQTVNMSCQQDASGACHYRNVAEGLNTGGTPVAVTIDSADAGLWSHVVNWPASYAVTGTFWPYTLNGDGGVPSHVTNFPASFGISGTLPAFAVTPTVNLGNAIPTGSNAIGSVSVSNFPATQAVSASALPLPSGAATSANQTNVQSAVGSSATTAVTIQGAASGVAVPVSCSNCSGGGGGAVTIAAGADATEGNVTDAAYTGSGNATIDALLKGLYAAATTTPLPAGSANTVVGATAGALRTAGGWTPKLLNGLSTTLVQVKASAGQLGMLQCYNPNSAQIYVQVIDSASPTLGTTAPALSIPIVPGGTGGFSLSGLGVQFNNAIEIAATTTATGSTAPTTAIDCNALFN